MMKRTLLYVSLVFFILLALLFLSFTADAQTVSPVIAEYKGKARGEFTVQNNGLTPLTVNIEPLSFTVDDKGQPRFTPLDTAHVHLKMDSFTVRIGAKQEHRFFYEVRCDRLPCWLSIYSTMVTGKTLQGIAVALHLPHTIYL